MITNWGAQSKRKVNIVVIEKWNIKTVGAKGRQIFFSGKAKQNTVGEKERQVFFSGKAKQKKAGQPSCSFRIVFCFALPLKKICLPFATTVFMFHFSMTTIFTFLLL